MTTNSAAVRAVIDGYDLAAERERYAFPDVVVGGTRLNRGTARVVVTSDPDDAFAEQARKSHQARLFTTTHGQDAPVLELGYPVAGHFVASHVGVHLDMYLGVAQKLLDENHPNLVAALDRLRDLRLSLRREIATDDYYAARPGAEGAVTTAMVAEALANLAQQAFPRRDGYRLFLCNSGTEANEAAIKLAQRVRYKRLVEKNGLALVARLMEQLGIGRAADLKPLGPDEPVWADYPFFLVACRGAFHGRTFGALHLTRSKSVHHVGYSKFPWVRHVPFNGPPDTLDRILDPRPLGEIVAGAGGVRAVLDKGLVPAELVALFAIEGFQGEGGYTLADRGFLAGVRATCDRHDILYLADEVQTFGRTGTVFVHEQLGVKPDVVTLAKGAWVGAMIAPAEFERYLEPGWHSNTWGGGKVFDNTISHATISTLTAWRDPLFLGRTYLENERVKGEYLRQRLAVLAEKHPEGLTGFNGLGCMFGLTVKRRDELIRLAWKRGMKLLGAGPAGEESRLRILFLADVLTREIDAFIDALDGVLSEMRGS